MKTNSSVPDTVECPTGSADPSFSERTFTVLVPGTAGTRSPLLSAGSAPLAPERSSQATAALAPPSRLPAPRAFRVAVALGPRGSGSPSWASFGEGPSGRRSESLTPPQPPRPSVWLAGTETETMTWKREPCGDPGEDFVSRGPAAPHRHPGYPALYLSRNPGSSWKVLSEHPLRWVCDL